MPVRSLIKIDGHAHQFPAWNVEEPGMAARKE